MEENNFNVSEKDSYTIRVSIVKKDVSGKEEILESQEGVSLLGALVKDADVDLLNNFEDAITFYFDGLFNGLHMVVTMSSLHRAWLEYLYNFGGLNIIVNEQKKLLDTLNVNMKTFTENPECSILKNASIE